MTTGSAPQTPRIAFFSNSSWAMSHYRKHVLKAFIAKGYSVYVFSPFDGTEQFLEDLGVVHVELPLKAQSYSPLNLLHCFFRLLFVFIKIRPEKLLCYTIKPIFLGAFLRIFSNFEFYAFFTGLGRVFESPSIVHTCVQKVLNLFLMNAKKVFLLNRDDVDVFQGQFPSLKEKVLLMPGEGVCLEKLVPKKKPQKLRNFLYLGRLIQTKGVKELVDVFKELSLLHNVQLKIVGSVDSADPLSYSQEEVNRWQQYAFVSVHLNKEDVLPFLEWSDCVVLNAYFREGLSRALLEGMAFGRVLLASNVPGNRELVSGNGVLFQSRDSTSLRESAEFLLELGEKEVQEMSDRSINLVQQYSDQELLRFYFDHINLTSYSEFRL